jgi:hypothetical protein
MANQIVTIDVTITKAPAPETLQQQGAVISQGATTLANGAFSLITEPADLTPLLAAALAAASATWAADVVTVTASAALPDHLPSGATFLTTLAGFTPSTVNGQYLATVTGADTFTVALSGSGSVSVAGTFTITDDLVSQIATFFDQGKSTPCYVLELGDGTVAQGVTALTAFITGTPAQFYSYLVPRSWDGVSQFLAFLAGYESTTAKTYFFVTTTTATYTDYTALLKCVVPLVESPTKPITEFTHAADWWVSLHYRPSGSNRVTKFAYSFLFGVTAYPVVGNAALLAELQAANCNYVAIASEGGLTNTMLVGGTTADGEDFTYWYSIDWAQLNLDLALSNAIINGSNNPINPLYYNQNGINTLQDVAVATFNQAITNGLALGPVVRTTLDPTDFTTALDDGNFAGEMVVNAIGFSDYTTENPDDYGIGKYDGLSGIYIVQNGFRTILFNIDVTVP